jgi:arylsulfate sulfotransferase
LSFFGGNVEQLANSDVEFDETVVDAFNAAVEELTYEAEPQLVWQLQIVGQFAYRGFRMPSLYPGV